MVIRNFGFRLNFFSSGIDVVGGGLLDSGAGFSNSRGLVFSGGPSFSGGAIIGGAKGFGGIALESGGGGLISKGLGSDLIPLLAAAMSSSIVRIYDLN